MSKFIQKQIVNLLSKYSLGFLYEKNPQKKMELLNKKKIEQISKTRIGNAIGISRGTGQRSAPFTDYMVYKKYFESPSEGDFLYPLKDYLKVITSGTMGRPKKYLLPKKALMDNMKKTGLAALLVNTHDGEKITFEIGDTFYTNIPGGSQVSAYLYEIGGNQMINFLNRCPDPNLPFQVKVDYFVDHYKEIDIAYMMVPTLLDEVYPRIGEPFNLKGFLTQDTAARVYKDKIMKITGNYPKVTYGSTESFAPSIASIQYPGAFIFDWRVHYYEFIPEQNMLETPSDPAEVEVVDLFNVEVDERYQLVLSPHLADIHRYLIPDIFQCVSLGEDVHNTDLPVFRYYSRADRLIVLHNFTRINEDELIQVISEAKIEHTDFTAQKIVEEHKDYMKIYVELKEPMPLEEVHRKINEAFIDIDKDWRDFVNFVKYIPLKIELLPRGTFKRYLSEKHGMYRIDRIGMKRENLNQLINDDI
ncbi:MAG: GH3 auxin-responsive promoter family protein [Candidatus Bathyarchaeota archaeon]|nr:GH3 auxin-responsive promoter family protein [Candidatus Bathyarchaeota archaeon]